MAPIKCAPTLKEASLVLVRAATEWFQSSPVKVGNHIYRWPILLRSPIALAFPHLVPDVNECEEGSAECEQTCANTEGGYDCGCLSGFSLLPPDNTSCIIQGQCANVKTWDRFITLILHSCHLQGHATT